ncbi:hypothetical protein A4H97_32795 [Niastella yeongjuensis]|uniref:Fis family transcriptional regulator n=1 Tax=Niastella yeongjuensis TaxID=354355 RepID=A0A1V9EHC3_9BACT|nr:sigma 54-interacting response regulator [Niastella yeongjuensis]OQP45295.1 hypothetical protein A4H97_32795 [Niastella yeongjuensis]SEO26816.1 formate hydrogenlyase transcriptional activator [Niastella yeongjuensis]
MRERLLIVEDEFIVANDLRMMLVNAGYEVCGIAASVRAAKEWVEKSKPNWVLLDIVLQDGSVGTDLAQYLRERNIGFIYVSANTNESVLEIAKSTQPYGFLVKPFRMNDLLIMLDIARSKHKHNLELATQREMLFRNQLRHITKFTVNQEQLLSFLPGLFRSFIPFDVMTIAVLSPNRTKKVEVCFVQTGYEEYELLPNEEVARLIQRVGPITIDEIEMSQGSQLLNGESFKQQLSPKTTDGVLSNHFRLESKLNFVLETDAQHLVFSFYSRNPDAFSQRQLEYLNKSEGHLRELSGALLRAFQPKTKNAAIKPVRIAVTAMARDGEKFPGIIGKSQVLLELLSGIEAVAATPVSVLIMGESGTGKEQIARSIHSLSTRRSKPFLTVNCAALPAELIESELFGHEKGAFTGAVEKRVGKFEAADGGTIFLDEIGELPIASQVKLLRVLQEMEFEPLGSSKTVKVNVRVVAATNRDLEKEIAANKFRLDLYYRLNVYPVSLPPLRARKEDIVLLAQYFLKQSAVMLERTEVPAISTNALRQLEAYDWPGNIRELRHLIERTIIRTTGPIITEVDLPASRHLTQSNTYLEGEYRTLEEMETDYILQVLQNCQGKVFGSGGAAEILGLPPSTLSSRIKKLGIRKELHFNK